MAYGLLNSRYSVKHSVCIQLWNDEDPNDEVLAMVVRTGCNSTIGNMLRHAMRPANFLTATDSLVTVITLPSPSMLVS